MCNQVNNSVETIGKVCGRCKKTKPVEEFQSPTGRGKGINKTYKWCNHCRKVNFGGKSVAEQKAAIKG